MTPAELKQHRLRLGMTQAQLADLLGVSTSSVSHWEQGTRTLKGLAAEAVRMKLAQILESPLEDIRKRLEPVTKTGAKR